VVREKHVATGDERKRASKVYHLTARGTFTKREQGYHGVTQENQPGDPALGADGKRPLAN